MIIRFNMSEGDDVELELVRNGSVKIRVGDAHVDNGCWVKDGNELELDVPASALVKGIIGRTDEDVSTEDVLVFKLG
jgi:hypothetical protein